MMIHITVEWDLEGKTEITIVANKKQEKRNVVLVIFSFENRLYSKLYSLKK